MIDTYAICEEIYKAKHWTTQKVIVALKNVAGNNFIDCRKWTDKNGVLQPSKGIFLSIEDWPPIMSLIKKMIDENCNSAIKNEPKKM